MEAFSCSRCGYESKRKENFFRHLRRKYPCQVKLQDVPIEDLLRKHLNYKTRLENSPWMEFIKKMNPNESKRIQMNPNESSSHSPPKPTQPKKYRCAGCKKRFTTNSNVRKHEKKCSKKNHLDRLEDLDQQTEVQEHEVRLVKTQNKSQAIVGNNNTINNNTQINNNNTHINNNNVTVNILPYEQTDVSHLTDRDYQRAFNRAAMCVPQILEKIHFDPEKPENHNVYISSMNNKYIKLHNGDRWNLRDREETIEDLFADAEYMLENKLETWQEEEAPKTERATKKFQIYLEVKEKAAMYNKIKQELKMLLFNNRSLITETNQS